MTTSTTVKIGENDITTLSYVTAATGDMYLQCSVECLNSLSSGESMLHSAACCYLRLMK